MTSGGSEAFFSLEAWRRLAEDERLQTVAALAERLTGFEAHDAPSGTAGLAALRHVETETVFVVAPGGTFRMGLSPQELKELMPVVRAETLDRSLLEWVYSSARPVRSVQVAPFLCSQAPATVAAVRRLCPGMGCHWGLPERMVDGLANPSAIR